MNKEQDSSIAVIGTRDQITLLRLAGVRLCRIIEESGSIQTEVSNAFKDFIQDPSITIIIIPEIWTKYIEEQKKTLQTRKSATPIILEIPGGFEHDKPDVKSFYKSYTKKLIGFAIEL